VQQAESRTGEKSGLLPRGGKFLPVRREIHRNLSSEPIHSPVGLGATGIFEGGKPEGGRRGGQVGQRGKKFISPVPI